MTDPFPYIVGGSRAWVGNSGVSVNQIIVVIKANGGQENRLGLWQKDGKLSLEDIELAESHASGEPQALLGKISTHFDTFDADNDGQLTLKDIPGLLEKLQFKDGSSIPGFLTGPFTPQMEDYMKRGFNLTE